ncbi:MAG: response regulator transcription factor [Acidobacteriia bacterium]|nr:response regulator transcription factor [Terriglobia bacterium]
MNEHILLVEDDQALRTSLRVRLRGEGYVVETAEDGKEAFEKATTLAFDMIILDIILPVRSGFDLCRDIRQAGLATPILFLTARTQTIDKVVGLRIGGDDYVTKPFKAVELIARIEALLRRAPSLPGKGIHQFGSICVDLGRVRVTRDGNPVYLSSREFQLLRYLIEHSGDVVHRTDILKSVWGYESGTLTRTVDMHIASLRQKLEENPQEPALIVTVPRHGYKFVGSKGN